MKTYSGNLLAMTLAVLAFIFFPLLSANAAPPGQVVAWGDNSSGASTIPAGSAVIAIAAGGSHTVILNSDGTVQAWGYNYFGQTNVPTGLSRNDSVERIFWV